MNSKLFIGIAVRNAKGLETLPGVWKSVADMKAWAAEAGYDTVVVTDEGREEVTVDRIADAVKANLQAGLDRIILYFAGHGFAVTPDQYLILSAGPDVPSQRITRDGFRDMLGSYGPKQISVITDACLVTRKFKGLAASVIDPLQSEAGQPTLDGFFATQEGDRAFAFHATENEPELCVFTWVMHRGLTFANLEACDRYLSTADRLVVTSGSLANFLDRDVPLEAAARNVWQQPSTNTGFRRPNDIYAERPVDKVQRRPGGPGPYDSHAIAPREQAKSEQSLRSRISSEWRAPFQDWAYNEASLESGKGGTLLIDSDDPNVEVFVQARTWRELHPIEPFSPTTRRHAFAFRVPSSLWSDGWRGPDGFSRTVLISVGKYSVLVALHRGLWCAVRMNVRVSDWKVPAVTEVVTWGSPDTNYKDEHYLSPLEVLKGLLSRKITADDAPRIAGALRVAKHQDPLVGIVAAYLYDSIGDVDNNRRMCWYYSYHRQDVPFDIALLARAPIERNGDAFIVHVPATREVEGDGPSYTREATPAATVGIAGIAPLLRAGWARLSATKQPLHDELAKLADELTGDAIATFEGPHARAELQRLLVIMQPAICD